MEASGSSSSPLILLRAFVWASLIAQLVKNPPAVRETLVLFPHPDDLLEKGTATHSSILGLPLWLNWERIHLQCRRPGFNPWAGKNPWRRERLPTPVFLGLPCGSAGKESSRNEGVLSILQILSNLYCFILSKSIMQQCLMTYV